MVRDDPDQGEGAQGVEIPVPRRGTTVGAHGRHGARGALAVRPHQPVPVGPAGVPTSPVRFSFCQRSRPPVSAVTQEWMRTRYIICR
ncbi:hypothetical protein SVIOM342S_09399 [Streptomyces violaceorubidus]